MTTVKKAIQWNAKTISMIAAIAIIIMGEIMGLYGLNNFNLDHKIYAAWRTDFGGTNYPLHLAAMGKATMWIFFLASAVIVCMAANKAIYAAAGRQGEVNITARNTGFFLYALVIVIADFPVEYISSELGIEWLWSYSTVIDVFQSYAAVGILTGPFLGFGFPFAIYSMAMEIRKP